jgi:hypothetical protein
MSEDDNSWTHLKQYGYAPGNYMVTCMGCKCLCYDMDKRALWCRPCAQQLYSEARKHELKTDPVPFDAVYQGLKTFEIRRNETTSVGICCTFAVPFLLERRCRKAGLSSTRVNSCGRR